MALAQKTKEIWLLDDEQEHHQSFGEKHAGYYHLVSFYRPQELYSSLKEGRQPDLLLIDVYFLREGAKGSSRLQEEWRGLMDELDRFRERYVGKYDALGLEVAGRLTEKGAKFPFMMYSAKASLFLRGEDYSRYAVLGEGFIFKGVEEGESERERIDSAIEEYRGCGDIKGLRNSRRLMFILMLTFFALFTIMVGFLLGLVLKIN